MALPKISNKFTDKQVADSYAQKLGFNDFASLQQHANTIGINQGDIFTSLRKVIAKQVIWKMLTRNNRLFKLISFEDSKWGGYDQLIASGQARVSRFMTYLDVNEHWVPDEIEQLVPTQFYDTFEIARNEVLERDAFLGESEWRKLIDFERSTLNDSLEYLWEHRLKQAFEEIPLYVKVEAKEDGADPSNKASAERTYWIGIADLIMRISDYMTLPSTIFNEKNWPANTPQANQVVVFNSKYFGKFNFNVIGDTYNFKDIANGGIFGGVTSYPLDDNIIAEIWDGRYAFYIANHVDKSADAYYGRTQMKDDFLHDFKKGARVRYANAVQIVKADPEAVTSSVWDNYDYKGKLIGKFEVTRKDITDDVSKGNIGVRFPFYMLSHLQNPITFQGAGDNPTETELKEAIKQFNPLFNVDNVVYSNITNKSAQLVPKPRADQKGYFYYALGFPVGVQDRSFQKLRFNYSKKAEV